METKKMTLTAAQNAVRETKYIVWNEDESKALQEKLFEIGCRWMIEGKSEQSVHHINKPFLFVNKDLVLSFSKREEYEHFVNKSFFYTEIEDVLNIEIQPEETKISKFDPHTLKPLDKVLTRDTENEEWHCDFFSHLTNDKYFGFRCVGSEYHFCIPLNDETEHLIGTCEEAPAFYQPY